MPIASLALVPALALCQQPVLQDHAPIRMGDDAANRWAEPFFPGAEYDLSVARPDDFLGQPVGSRLASHDEMLAILGAIAGSSPRVTMEAYGRTYEGRPLVTLTITSPRNHARMEAIRAANFLFDRDPHGSAWIEFNKVAPKAGQEGRGRAGRTGGRRRR